LDSVARADSCDNDTGESGRRKRNCLANRTVAKDKSLAKRALASLTRQHSTDRAPQSLTSTHGQSTRLTAMAGPEPPSLPAVLLQPWPVIVAIAAGWLVAAILAFTVQALQEWRPVTIAGLAVGVLGTSIFLWQRRAVRRGSRGAQSGLT
jgi:hypothetical protein